MSADVSAPPLRTDAPWETRPGWGISVDLLPREVRQGRRARVHKRLVVLGLLVVLLLCGGLLLWSMADRSMAEQSFEDAQRQTTVLKAEEAEYGDVTTAQNVLDDTQTQVSTLMSQDVDVVNLIARIRSAVPPGVTIGNIAVLLAPPTAGAANAVQTPSGQTIIGSVTISGGGPEIKALAPFIADLNHLQGVVDVVPGSTTQSDEGMNYALSLNFTDALYTHRFDPEAAQ